MATLEQDLYDAFAGSTVGDQFGYKTDEGKTILNETEDDGNIKRLAKDIATAIHEWITKQTFTIVEMKASAEIEDIVLIASEVLAMSGVAVATSGGPGATTAPVMSKPNLKLKKGNMSTFGHAWIGPDSMIVRGPAGSTDTADNHASGQWNTYSKVKLNPNTKESLYKQS